MIMERSTKRIICIHQANGKTHDFKLFKKSKLPLEQKINIKADAGYQGMEKIHGNTEFPRKSSKLHPLTKKEKKMNLK
jgi:hypothetical protein